MNFIAAIQHATIGYGIRRTAWPKNVQAVLYLDQTSLHWSHEKPGPEGVQLLGPDECYDLTEDDIKATDWDIVQP